MPVGRAPEAGPRRGSRSLDRTRFSLAEVPSSIGRRAAWSPHRAPSSARRQGQGLEPLATSSPTRAHRKAGATQEPGACPIRCATRDHVLPTRLRLPYADNTIIRSFADKDTEALYNGENPRRIPADIRTRARRKLDLLNAARSLRDLESPPGNHLEPLHGDRQGQHSIRINQQWRICFRFEAGDAYDVEIVDYH